VLNLFGNLKLAFDDLLDEFRGSYIAPSCVEEALESDSYVEVERAFYEAPPELIGREVWVRWDSRCVRIFNERMEQVGMHPRKEAGKFSRTLGAGGFSAPVLSSCRYWVSRAAVLGEECGQWTQLAGSNRTELSTAYRWIQQAINRRLIAFGRQKSLCASVNIKKTFPRNLSR
jgi:hypothetical protein